MPTLPGAAGLYGAFFILMALIGTGSGSLTNLNYSYFIYRKGWRNDGYLNRQRVDLLLSLTCMFALCALVQLAAAGTLRPMAAQLKGVDDLSRILSQTGGRLGGIAFAFGLGAVALSVFVGATTGFALIVTDICRNLLPVFGGTSAGESGNRHPERDIVYRGSVLFSVLSPLYILFTGVRPVWLVLFVSSLTFALAPLLAAGLLWMTNDRRRLGRHTNGWLTNVVLAALIVTSLLLACKNAYDVLASR
jgi:Mn2+/Fe2+ NRAMP family transporter